MISLLTLIERLQNDIFTVLAGIFEPEVDFIFIIVLSHCILATVCYFLSKFLFHYTQKASDIAF